MSDKVVAIVSGGLDSVVMLKQLVDEGHEVLVLNFSYGSKHNKAERRSLLNICDMMNLPTYLFDIPVNIKKCHPRSFNSYDNVSLLSSDLLQSGDDVPEGHYEDPNMKQTVVPFRNGIMLSIAVGFAESYGAKAVYFANHAGDHAVYPDCRQEFAVAIDIAAQLGTYEKIEVRSPFAKMTKAQIAKLGVEIGARLDLTWSCYCGGDRPCLKCATCVERTEAFHLNNLKDPALTIEEWDQAVLYMRAAINDKKVG